MKQLIAACLGLAGLFSAVAAPLPRPYAVDHYGVRLHLDLPGKHLSGEVRIDFHSTIDSDFAALELDAGALEIKSVSEGQASQYFERHGELLVVVLTAPLHPTEHRTITVQYQAGAAKGLQFFPDQIYTSAHTSDWMVCNDRPDNPATLHLEIDAPQGAKVAASGRERASGWDLESPAPPSLFGFAVGTLVDTVSEQAGVKLRILGNPTPIVEPTAAALRYFAERTGKPFPGPTYTQVFVRGDTSQSLAGGLTLLPESYAEGFRQHPDNLWLLADELAHQWYGVAIAPRDWSDLWLSDGLSAFLADTFLEHQFGKERYEREIEASREAYQGLKCEGKDRSLFFPDWKTAQDADGPIPTHKGVGFLYLLRGAMGDTPFWSGLRQFTAEQWGHTVTSEDFQRAMSAVDSGGGKASKSSPKSQSELFDQWVYGLAAAKKK